MTTLSTMMKEIVEEIENITKSKCNFSEEGFAVFYTAAVGCQHYATPDESLRETPVRIEIDDEFRGLAVRWSEGMVGDLNKNLAFILFDRVKRDEIEIHGVVERFGRFKAKMKVFFREISLKQTSQQLSIASGSIDNFSTSASAPSSASSLSSSSSSHSLCSTIPQTQPRLPLTSPSSLSNTSTSPSNSVLSMSSSAIVAKRFPSEITPEMFPEIKRHRR
jgi:hypothetical protein